MPENLFGLPTHVLLQHVVVVLLPIAAVGALLVAVWAWYRHHLGVVTLVATFLVTLAVPLTTQSGESLEGRLPDSPSIAAHATAGDRVLWVAAFGTQWVRAAAMIAIPYLVLILAYRTPRSISVITRPGDLSYGIYVYSFPAQQVAAYAFGPKLGPLGMLGVVALPVYGLAFLSWRLIEAPALRLKPRARRAVDQRPTLVQAAVVD